MVAGKVWKPKEKEKIQITDDGDEDVETEWDEVLQNASEEELVDLAGWYYEKGKVTIKCQSTTWL